MIKDLRGRHSSTEPELGWEVSLWIPGTAGNLLAKLLIFNEYNLFCIFYRKERNISRPSIRVASVCVCVLSPWHQPGRPKKLSAASLASDSRHGAECAFAWHVGISLPRLHRPQKHQGGRGLTLWQGRHIQRPQVCLLSSSQTWQQLQSVYLENPQR